MLLTALLLAMAGCAKEESAAPENGGVQSLHVDGYRLADGNGKTVQLTGMSSHGVLWYPQYTNANAMKTLKSYGANTFRVAAYSDDQGGGYVQRPEETKQFVYMTVENAISEDMYVIVDWHVLGDKNPLTNLENAKAFFEEISAHYGDCPNILYEICNEPNGGTSWDDIYKYAEQIIPVIRNHAPNAVIIVGTPNFSYALEKVFDRPLDDENVMYSFHYYAGQFGDSYVDLFSRCEKENIPVFVTEWGVNNGGDGKPALSDAERFVTVLNRRKISWTAWSLSNKEEVFSAIQKDCYKYSGWESGDLTEVGKLFFESF